MICLRNNILVAVNATNAFNLLVGQQFFSLSACYDRMCILVTISQGSRVDSDAGCGPIGERHYKHHRIVSLSPHCSPCSNQNWQLNISTWLPRGYWLLTRASAPCALGRAAGGQQLDKFGVCGRRQDSLDTAKPRPNTNLRSIFP